MFFKRMNKTESVNSKRAAEAGFITYMLLTAINYFCYLLIEQTFLSNFNFSGVDWSYSLDMVYSSTAKKKVNRSTLKYSQ